MLLVAKGLGVFYLDTCTAMHCSQEMQLIEICGYHCNHAACEVRSVTGLLLSEGCYLHGHNSVVHS